MSTSGTSVRSSLKVGDLVRISPTQAQITPALLDGLGILVSIYHQPQADKKFGEILINGQIRWVRLDYLEPVQDTERVVQ
jgi:hypothetical protein